MSSSRSRSGKAGADAPAKTTAKDTTAKPGKQDDPQPEKHAQDGGNAAGEGADVTQQAGAEALHQSGEPQPEKVAKGMVRPETGVSPSVPEGGNAPQTAAYGADERNGAPTGIPIDTSGEMRHADGLPATAAHGQDARNGHVTGMDAEGQVDRSFGGNDEAQAPLAGDGVRAEVGVGTLNRDLPKDERPTYPSTTLTRANSKAAPREPEDVRRATEPRMGDVKTSTDPTMAASAMPSMPGDQTVKLVNRAGNAVKPSNFFEVPDGPQARSLRRVKYRVSEVFTVRHVKTPSKRLLFTEGQMVPVAVAEALIALHG